MRYKQLPILAGAFILGALFFGYSYVTAQQWSEPLSPSPTNNAGQPVTLNNPQNYVRKSLTATQTVLGPMDASIGASYPSYFGGGISDTIAVTGSGTSSVTDPSGAIGISAYGVGTDYGLVGFSDAGATGSYGVVGFADSGGTAGEFYGPVQIVDNAVSADSGDLTVGGSANFDEGIRCTASGTCSVLSSPWLDVTITNASNPQDAIDIRGGVVIDIEQGVSTGYGVDGSSLSSAGVYGTGNRGIYAYVTGTKSGIEYRSVGGLNAVDGNGVHGVSTGGLGHQGSASSGGVAPEVVDSAGPFHDGNASIAIDSEGYPVVAYYDDIDQSLYFVKCNNTSCSSHTTPVELDDFSSNNVGQWNSIVVPADGLPVIAYSYGGGPSTLRILRCNDIDCSGAFTRETITASVESVSIAVHSDDNFPIIAYDEGGSTKFVDCGDPTCDPALFDSGLTPITIHGTYNNYKTDNRYLTVGGDGYPVMTIRDPGAGLGSDTLYVAHCTDEHCTGAIDIEYIDTIPNYDTESSITTNSSGYPVIAYNKFDSFPDELLVATCTNYRCSANSISSPAVASDNIHHPVIKMGCDGSPVILYTTLVPSELHVVKCGDALCNSVSSNTQIVSSLGDNETYDMDLTNCPNGYPAISFIDASLDLNILGCTDDACTTVGPPVASDAYDFPAGIRACNKDGSAQIVNTRGVLGFGENYAAYFDGDGGGDDEDDGSLFIAGVCSDDSYDTCYSDADCSGGGTCFNKIHIGSNYLTIRNVRGLYCKANGIAVGDCH